MLFAVSGILLSGVFELVTPYTAYFVVFYLAVLGWDDYAFGFPPYFVGVFLPNSLLSSILHVLGDHVILAFVSLRCISRGRDVSVFCIAERAVYFFLPSASRYFMRNGDVLARRAVPPPHHHHFSAGVNLADPVPVLVCPGWGFWLCIPASPDGL